MIEEAADTTSLTSLYSSDLSPRAASEDRLSSVTASSPVPLPHSGGERGDVSLDSGVVTSPSPPTDSGLALLSPPTTARNRNNNQSNSQEDSASVLSCSLSEASDTSGSRYDNVVTNSGEPGSGQRGGSVEEELSDSSQENCLDNNNHLRERDSTYENLTPEILSNVYSKSGLNSLRKILTNGQTTNV